MPDSQMNTIYLLHGKELLGIKDLKFKRGLTVCYHSFIVYVSFKVDAQCDLFLLFKGNCDFDSS